jgi:hypothetical protein
MEVALLVEKLERSQAAGTEATVLALRVSQIRSLEPAPGFPGSYHAASRSLGPPLG